MELCSNCKYLLRNVFCVLSISILFCLPPLVDADEIRRLGKRFRKLDLDNSGALSLDEFLSLPELQQNPLVQRVIDIFDEDGNGEVDFKGTLITPKLSWDVFFNNSFSSLEFIQGVSQFSVKGDKESKLRFAFRIYDMDNDGYISNGELFQVYTIEFNIYP